jgi:hypothetical protein
MRVSADYRRGLMPDDWKAASRAEKRAGKEAARAERRARREVSRAEGRGFGIGGLIGLSVLLSLFWLVWPYYSLYELSIALRDGDALALEGQIAWESVREGLRGDLNAIFLGSLRSEKPGFGNEIAAIVGPAIIHQVIESYVTPATVATLIRNGRPTLTAADVSTTAGSGVKNLDPDAVARLLGGKSGPHPADASSASGDHAKQFSFRRVRYAFFSGGPFTFKVEVSPPSEALTKNPLWPAPGSVDTRLS